VSSGLFLFLFLLLPPLLLLALLVAGLLRRPRLLEGPARPALILAAHPDDCVILAGGYGIFARQAGATVRVAYLTCGAASPDLPRAQTRRQEAHAAWGQLGLASGDIVSGDLPEHAPHDRSSWSADDRNRARLWIGNLLEALPPDALVFLPAAGESHVDHRGLRQLALEAWQLCGRRDLCFMEGAEYNDYLSVVGAPERILVDLLRAIPGLSRLGRRRRRAPWAGFAGAGPVWQLPPDPARDEQRRRLLRAFASENGELLVHLFGWHERYRPLPDPATGLGREPPSGYLFLDQRHRGFSALLLLLVLLEGAAALGSVTASAAVSAIAALSSPLLLIDVQLAAIWLGLGALMLARRRRILVESRLLYLGLGLGALTAVARAW
jgi:LmbE family N-acetylglucosaminyl deacetylase